MATTLTDRLGGSSSIAPGSDLAALEALAGTGIAVRAGASSWVLRSVVVSGSFLGITNADGVSGDITITLTAPDLAAIEALASTGFAVRTASNTWAQRSIAGTTNKITVTNGNGVGGDPTLTVGSDIAQLTVEDQVVTGGARVTVKDLGTMTTGTLTPDPGDRPHQKYTNNGAHTLAPGTNQGSYWLDITNGASAGAVTVSGWTKVVGTFTTTNGHKFACVVHISDIGSLLSITAMQ